MKRFISMGLATLDPVTQLYTYETQVMIFTLYKGGSCLAMLSALYKGRFLLYGKDFHSI